MYGKGVIVRKYQKNQVIKVRVELTANHMGYFQFRVCPNNNPKKPATQACLDEYVLQNAVDREDRYYPGPGSKVFEMHFQLPKDLTCRQCVFQWRYVAGNNWGVCKNGTETVGCGPQEEFRACADVTITEDDGSADDRPNTLEDDEVYVPTDDDRYNEVDFDEQNQDKHQDEEKEEMIQNEIRIVIIVICSFLTVAVFFILLFCYYTKGRKYISDRDWDLPKLPKVPAVNWPLSNVQIKTLPQLWHRGSKTKEDRAAAPATSRTVSAPINMLSSTNEAATGPPNAAMSMPKAVPRPPPRCRKQPAPGVPSAAQQQQQPRLATITARPHTGTPVVRPMAPPPVIPPGAVEISEPTAVTINGVSVSSNSSPTRSPDSEDVTVSPVGGYIVPARPAMADSDLPDSMDQSSLPPLPSNPPPEFDDVDLSNKDSSEA